MEEERSPESAPEGETFRASAEETHPARRRWLRLAAAAVVVVCVLGLAGMYAGYRMVLTTLPKLDRATDYQPLLPTVFYDVKGRVIAEYGEQRRILVPTSAIPQHVVQAFLAAEDASFFEHSGINFMAILRAAVKNVTSGKVKQGASTITQQVAKTFFLTPERTIWRKVREAALAFRIEEVMTKDEILHLYLNQIYFGAGAYGVESASQVYFAKSISDVTVAEAAVLAGLPQAPSSYSPYNHPDRARARQLYVLDQMEKNGFLTPEQGADARSEIVAIRYWRNPAAKAGHIAEHVRRYLVDTYGEERVLQGGYRVETSIDIDLQFAAQQAVQRGVQALEKRHGYRGPLRNVAEKEWPETIRKLDRALREPEVGDIIQTIGPAVTAPVEADAPRMPNKPVEALVTAVTSGRADLAVGNQKAVLPLFEMTWASKFNPERKSEDYPLRSVKQALKKGDVILVEIFDPAPLAKGSVEDRKRAEEWKKLKLTPDVWAATLVPTVEAESALVAIDAQTAEIRAMVGGYAFEKSQFNRAVQAQRQPGSSFKPVVYAAAVTFGYNPATMVVDSPDVFEEMPEGTTEVTLWKPKNYDEKFLGPITMREALVKSRNVPTIRIAQDIGLKAILQMAGDLGITSPLNNDLSIALGSNGVSLMEMVNVYETFNAGGIRRDPRIIRRIVAPDGRVIEQQVPDWVLDPARKVTGAERDAQNAQYYRAREVLDPVQAHTMVHMLKGVVQSGTGWRARALGRPAGGKTGTTNDNVDSWFIGFTPQLTAGVWVGYDQPDRNLGPYETGSLAANPIWNDFMLAAHKGLPVVDWEPPADVVYKDIDTKTGMLAGPSTEKSVSMPFRYGTEPTHATAAESRPSEVDLLKLDMGF